MTVISVAVQRGFLMNRFFAATALNLVVDNAGMKTFL
jgi:hypothetical protein